MNLNAFDDDHQVDIHRYFERLRICDELSSVPLPSFDLIWWRSRLAERHQLARRSIAAIESIRLASVILASICIVLALCFEAPRLFGSLPVPLPFTVASLILFGCSTGGVLFVWARQR